MLDATWRTGGGGPDIITGGITFGGGTLETADAFGTPTTIVCEPGIGILFEICPSPGNKLGGGMFGGGKLVGCNGPEGPTPHWRPDESDDTNSVVDDADDEVVNADGCCNVVDVNEEGRAAEVEEVEQEEDGNDKSGGGGGGDDSSNDDVGCANGIGGGGGGKLCKLGGTVREMCMFGGGMAVFGGTD